MLQIMQEYAVGNAMNEERARCMRKTEYNVCRISQTDLMYVENRIQCAADRVNGPDVWGRRSRPYRLFALLAFKELVRCWRIKLMQPAAEDVAAQCAEHAGAAERV